MGDVIDERDVDMWGEDTSGHDTACDCKGCLLNEWEAESRVLDRYRKALERIDGLMKRWNPPLSAPGGDMRDPAYAAAAAWAAVGSEAHKIAHDALEGDV